MTQTDEKELVLGNKQLISLFFVVVALCGVFFAMGYMIGRNSTKATVVANADTAPAPVPAPEQRQQPEPPRETAAPPDTSQPAPDPTAVTTRPAQDTPAGAAMPPAREYAAPTASIAPTVPETGASYIQVGALPRADAETVIKTLREQTFPAVLAASSKEGLFRVLVGPYRQTSQLADAKNRLKTLGFANTIVQKQ